MLSLSVKIRQSLGRRVKYLRKKGILPGVLYGPELEESLPLEIDEKEFEKIYREARESTLIKLKIKNEKSSTKTRPRAGLKMDEFLVLIHEISRDPLTGKPIHVDFYQPKLKEEVEAMVPLVFEGESPAVKNLRGTLVKNISEVKIKALPQNLPHEIKVNIEKLKTFEDNILIKDLNIPKEVKILKDPEEIVAQVTPPEKVEEELVKPIEEKVEEVEKVEKKPKEEIEETKK